LKRVKYGQRRRNHNKYDEWVYSAPTRDEVERWELEVGFKIGK
jgi:hypothetical protein